MIKMDKMIKDISKLLENVKEGFKLDDNMKITVDVKSFEDYINCKTAFEEKGYFVRGEGNFCKNPSYSDLKLIVTTIQSKK